MKAGTVISISAIALATTGSQIIDEPQWSEKVRVVLDNTKELKYDRGDRLPLYLWPAIDPGVTDDKSAELLVNEFNKRGVGIVSTWKLKNVDMDISQVISVAKAQKKLGQRINIDATSILYGFYDGENSGHIDKNGKQFYDDSFGKDHKMGCPFTTDARKNDIRKRVEYFLKKYKDEGLEIGFIFADWEIDGPIEVNNSWESSKKCTRCLSHLGENFTFNEFRKTMREMRSYLQNYSYSSPVLSYFPDALVGNYAVYPNDGYRYWYDYFEFFTEIHPYKKDQRAIYREWYNDFPLTGYTFAMPVVYTWWKTFTWYDFKNTDYRWFYNMLLNASNAGRSTPQNIPIISFVHWHTIFDGSKPDPAILQMSKNAYQELLWHMLLRGTDTFFMWSGKDEFPDETKLVHEVYAAAQEYGNFLEKGIPINFDVPDKPGTVISGLALDNQVLVRRTDFDGNDKPVKVMAGTKIVTVNSTPGKCNVLSLD